MLMQQVGTERFLGRITPGMRLRDVDGHKLGKICDVHRDESAGLESSSVPQFEEVIEAKTGFLGLGSHLYVPMSAVLEVIGENVFLKKSDDALADDLEHWRDRPEYVSQ